MKLNYRTLGGGQPLIILHGVFGSSDNWQTLGKVFSENFKVYLIDQRNHGKSPHSKVFDYETMAQDVVELMDDEGIDSAFVLGHSMGGKVAMLLAAKYPERVDKLIVVDIAPKYYPPHHQQIFEGFHAVKLDSLKSRKEADDQMSHVISNPGIRQFILKNLERHPDGSFGWKLNLDVIEAAADHVGEGITGNEPFTGPALFIAGGRSDYIQTADYELIRKYFPNAQIVTVEGAGHWVHAEKPKELARLVIDFLTQ